MCFFFQAEDGIRDKLVTGVQTCALPISVKYRIDGHTREQLLFFEWNAKFLVCPEEFRIQFLQALQTWLPLGSRIIGNILIIDGSILDVSPLRLSLRLLQRLPVPVSLKPPLKHELRFVLLGRDQANDVFIQALGDPFFLNISDEAPLVFSLGQISNRVDVGTHCVLPEIKLILGTSLPLASFIAMSCKGWMRSPNVSFSSAPRTT